MVRSLSKSQQAPGPSLSKATARPGAAESASSAVHMRVVVSRAFVCDYLPVGFLGISSAPNLSGDVFNNNSGNNNENDN